MSRAWRRAAAVLGAAALLSVGLAGPARAATHEVTVSDSGFSPKVIKIAPGDTVRWTAASPGHTVTARDGRFNFHPPRTLGAGEQVSWTFPTEEFVQYYCRIHPGMEGLVQVGDPPVEPVPPGPTLIVPDQVATIAAAAAAAEPDTEILIRPGTYHDEEIALTTPGLTLRGLGVHPGEVILSGGNDLASGVTITAPRSRIVNLTVTAYRRSGVVVDGASAAVLDDTVLDANGLYGVEARGPTGLALRSVQARGHGVAGIGVRDCTACGTRIDSALIEGNAAGIVTVAATGVVIRSSHLRQNAVGVVLRDTAGSQVVGNTLTGNAATNVWVASAFDGPEPPSGAGVWISGGRANQVESNTASGHTYNVAVSGPTPALRHRIAGNNVADATYADLGWDGIGAGVCFSGNKGPLGSEPTSDPPAAQVLYDCDAAATAGLPYPVVTANLASHARAAGYPI